MSLEQSKNTNPNSFDQELNLHKSTKSSSKHLGNDTIPFIRRGTVDDTWNIFELYKKVSSIYPDSLAQQVDEISFSYIKSIIEDAHLRGLILLMFNNENLIGILKGYTSEFRRKAHVLTNVTMMIDSNTVGQGLGTQLLKAYQDEIQKSFQHIRVMELLPYNSNIKGIGLYKKMGFVLTATLPGKIRYIDGTFGDQLLMNWTNPNFSNQALLEYYEHLQKLINQT
jgi:RimJ/RimL family protein N-acetyltransferase